MNRCLLATIDDITAIVAALGQLVSREQTPHVNHPSVSPMHM